ncbi:MAG: ATP-dependent helicase [Alphaproteobacteria bacterium]|nr:MAG: ATP-dependent helicase [Alphaproteobacteria bacterium]
MTIAPHQACYFAHELTRLGALGELDRLSATLFDSKVDLNPHQIDAALFALSNPLQQGVILADEVGLGKTIEAGLVLCQRWAERRRKLIVVCPAHIRKQWQSELTEKFALPSVVVDRRAYRQLQADGYPNPFDCGKVVIISYGFASRTKEELRATPFDLVVMDEAHKLRNAYQPSRKGGQAVRWAFELRQKLLLTATPLQNSLLELYGLGWVIGDHVFGDKSGFQTRYCNAGGDLQELRARLAQVCKRSLRRDCAYINYTKRQALTHPFAQTEEEKRLHRDVMDFMTREISYAFPQRQRQLIEMILFKTLASSPQALASTLGTMRRRLIEIRDGLADGEDDDLINDLCLDDDLDVESMLDQLDPDDVEAMTHPAVQGRLLAEELDTLDGLIRRAERIQSDSKSKALLTALKAAFDRLADVGARRKALIFTESRKTQAFLAAYLEANGYAGKVVVFNGSNTHPAAKRAYERYVKTHAGTDKLTGSKPIDIRSALIEEFRDHAEILLATEAAAEGVNLQFCSLVVNYDLPWNPQRIEQRIGRCHRYGQRHDVIVVNFLSQDNLADRRVHDLLQQKFSLFDGLFGASDEVLGAIEDGVDFEKRVYDILKTCRTDAEIEAAFDALQRELEDTISLKMTEAQKQLFEHFDADVHERLKLRSEYARDALDRVGERFWKLARWGLEGRARFNEPNLEFDLSEPPEPGIPTGRYRLMSAARSDEDYAATEAHLLRLSSPLGQWLTSTAKSQRFDSATVVFDATSHPRRISMLEPLVGHRGWMVLDLLDYHSDDQEQFLLLTAVTDDGINVDQEILQRLMDVPGAGHPDAGECPPDVLERLDGDAHILARATISRAADNSNGRFKQIQVQINQWADDKITGAEHELDQIKKSLRAARRSAEQAETMQLRQEAEERVAQLERKQRHQRRAIFDLEDEIEIQRKNLIAELAQRASQDTRVHRIFLARWEVR